jgi:hypothetical protein
MEVRDVPDNDMPVGVHVVGSVPLGDAEEVFRTIAEGLGDRVRRIPDGETGERVMFTLWQASVFAGHPDFQPMRDRSMLRLVQTYELRPGVDPGGLRFEELGYARVAQCSYQVFQRLREEGVIRPGVRFQVSLPTPPGTLSLLVPSRDAGAVEPAYEAAMLAEVERIAAAIPPSDLAIQWDVPYEVRVWEGRVPRFMTPHWYGEDAKTRIVESLTRLGAGVPAEAQLGYHLCHGDFEHSANLFFRLRRGPRSQALRRAAGRVMDGIARRVVGAPRSAAPVSEMASAVAVSARRPIDYVHMAVPRGADDVWFRPLASLELQPRTELFLGLVHFRDGLRATRRRIAAARRVITEFGVATECGWGRREPETIPGLIRLHREVSAPVHGRSGNQR